MLNSATSSPSGAGQLLSMLSGGGFDKVVGNLGGILGGGQGSVDQLIGTGKQVLASLFGNKLGGVTSALSGSTGVSTGTGTSILAIAAPVVMGLVGKQVSSGGLNASGLLNLLSSNKDAIAKFAPAGLASALGLGSIGELGTKASALLRESTREASSTARTWVPVAVIAALALLAFLIFRGREDQTATGGSGPATRKIASVALPGGGNLNVEQDTFLYNLAGYLGNASDTRVPKTFIFENLNFESGGTTLTPASSATVTDLTRVLSAYPNSKVKLVGYTDTTGDPAANKALSLDRAKAVGEMLSKGGVSGTGSRLTAWARTTRWRPTTPRQAAPGTGDWSSSSPRSEASSAVNTPAAGVSEQPVTFDQRPGWDYRSAIAASGSLGSGPLDPPNQVCPEQVWRCR